MFGLKKTTDHIHFLNQSIPFYITTSYYNIQCLQSSAMPVYGYSGYLLSANLLSGLHAN